MGPKKTSGDRLVQIKHLPLGALMAPPNCSPTLLKLLNLPRIPNNGPLMKNSIIRLISTVSDGVPEE